MIRYDRSPHSVLVWCSCGWREITLTQAGAWRIALHHETLAHPDRDQVRTAQRVRDHRHRNEPDSRADSQDDRGM